MQRTIRIDGSGSASAALLALAGNVRADVVETRELEETMPVTAGQPLVVIVKNIIGLRSRDGARRRQGRDARDGNGARRPASRHRARPRGAPAFAPRASPAASRFASAPRRERRSHRDGDCDCRTAGTRLQRRVRHRGARAARRDARRRDGHRRRRDGRGRQRRLQVANVNGARPARRALVGSGSDPHRQRRRRSHVRARSRGAPRFEPSTASST